MLMISLCSLYICSVHVVPNAHDAGSPSVQACGGGLGWEALWEKPWEAFGEALKALKALRPWDLKTVKNHMTVKSRFGHKRFVSWS